MCGFSVVPIMMFMIRKNLVTIVTIVEKEQRNFECTIKYWFLICVYNLRNALKYYYLYFVLDQEALDMVGLCTNSKSLLYWTWNYGDILGFTRWKQFVTYQRVPGIVSFIICILDKPFFLYLITNKKNNKKHDGQIK